ncbi:hypothetical protein H0X09_02795 [Candidatus Saccharibacteria bacterium]|nr:hypothetical protein [Candidatus Saccharibacteria bacterium]
MSPIEIGDVERHADNSVWRRFTDSDELVEGSLYAFSGSKRVFLRSDDDHGLGLSVEKNTLNEAQRAVTEEALALGAIKHIRSSGARIELPKLRKIRD